MNFSAWRTDEFRVLVKTGMNEFLSQQYVSSQLKIYKYLLDCLIHTIVKVKIIEFT